MDTIKFILESGKEYKLPDISEDKFDEFLWESGSNDTEYYRYLKEHNMQDLSELNAETISELTLVVEDNSRGRVMKFKCVYDSDNN